MAGGKIIVVCGGQMGSEGKGSVAGYLAAQEKNLLAIRVAGPNAGHSVYGECRGLVHSIGSTIGQGGPCVVCQDSGWERHALRQLPVAAVTNRGAHLAIAAGSELDLAVLADELRTVGVGIGRLMVDPQATVIREGDRAAEAGLVHSIGSTGKGVGGARAARIMRNAKIAADANIPSVTMADVATEARRWLAWGGTVMVEGAQGYGLGLHAGYYPFTTSSDCRAIDFLAMAGINPWGGENREAWPESRGGPELEVWVVFRTYPIRVAGNSGPMREETTWEALAERTGGYIQPELTTVTQRVRRVGEWDDLMAKAAVEVNGGREAVNVALTMVDYWDPSVAGVESKQQFLMQAHVGLLKRLNGLGVSPTLLGTGPHSIVDWRVE